MKKYLFFSLVFAATITAFTNCSKSSDVYAPGRPEQDAQDLYKKNFLAYVEGPINGAVDWGFGSATVKSGTRADGPDTTKVVLDSKGYSSMFYNDFFATVESTFPQNAVCTDKTWYNYEFHERGKFCNIRLIYTNTSLKDEIGLYYYDPTKETYENAKEIKLIEDLQEADLGNYFQYNRYKDLDEYWEDPEKTDAYSKWHRDPNPVVRLQSRTWTVYMNGDYYFGIYVRNKDAEGKTHTYYTNQFKNADENAYSGAAIGDVSKGDVEKCYVFGVSDDNQPNCNLLFAIIQAGEDGLVVGELGKTGGQVVLGGQGIGLGQAALGQVGEDVALGGVTVGQALVEVLLGRLVVLGGRCREGGVVGGVVVGNGAGGGHGDVCGALEELAGLGHVAQLVGIVGILIIAVHNLLQLGVHLLGLFTQLESLGVSLGGLSQEVSLNRGGGYVGNHQHAGLVEVNVHVGELNLLIVLSLYLYLGHRCVLLLVHHGERGLVYTRSNVDKRVVIGSHVGLAQLNPGAGLGSLLGILGGGKGLLDILLHFCSRFLCKRDLQRAGQRKNGK